MSTRRPGSSRAASQLLGGGLLVETLGGLAAGTVAAPAGGGADLQPPDSPRGRAGGLGAPGRGDLRRLRAFTPWPGLFTFLEGERVKILEATRRGAPERAPPGAFALDGERLVAAAGSGTSLAIGRLQRAGRKPVTGAEFARAVGLPGRFGAS